MAERRVRTLIVDDDDDMRLLLRVVIERANEGLEVVADAADGVAGLAAWRETQPDAVVTDQRMPGMSGIELAALMIGEVPGTPVILCSAFIDAIRQDSVSSVAVASALPRMPT